MLRLREDATADGILDCHGDDGAKPTCGDPHLTRCEIVVVDLIVGGASNKEAARLLRISPRTVEFHRANAMRKLGVHKTADLVRMMIESGREPSPAEIRGQ